MDIEMFRVIIAGTRTFNDYELLKERCDYFFSNRKPTLVLCGEARGADTLGKRYARENGITVASYPAAWDKHGKAAGAIRNSEMLENADALIAFWDGKSRGTSHMISIARANGIPVRVVTYNP